MAVPTAEVEELVNTLSVNVELVKPTALPIPPEAADIPEPYAIVLSKLPAPVNVTEMVGWSPEQIVWLEAEITGLG